MRFFFFSLCKAPKSAALIGDWAMQLRLHFKLQAQFRLCSTSAIFFLPKHEGEQTNPNFHVGCVCLNSNEMSRACFPKSTWVRSSLCQYKLMHKDDHTAKMPLLNWALRCHTVKKKKTRRRRGAASAIHFKSKAFNFLSIFALLS